MFSRSASVHVSFIATDKLTYENWPKPVLASENKPSWWEKMQQYIGGRPAVVAYKSSSDLNPTAKQCMPLHDVMTAGYHILLPCDVFIDLDSSTGRKKIVWGTSMPNMISNHNPEQVEGYPVPEGFETLPYKWSNSWIVKTPPGWSCIFQHPAYHDHLPFRSLSAIVDTDRHDMAVLFPFLLKQSFSGSIPRGTPIAQVIPFRRADVKATYTWDEDGSFATKKHAFYQTLFHAYRKFFRQPKPYSIEEAPQGKCPFHSRDTSIGNSGESK